MNRYRVCALALPLLLVSCGDERSSRGPIDPYFRVEWPAPLERFHSVQYVEVPDHPASVFATLTHRAFLDMNGDGLLDLIATVDPEPASPGIRRVSTLHVALNEGGRMGPLGEWKLPTGAHVDGIQGEILPCEGMLSWRIADLDGDGRPDFIVTGIGSGEEPSCETRPFGDFGDDLGFHWLLYRNLGDRFAEEGRVFRVPGWQRELTTKSADHADYDLRDMDGDGLPDLVITWSHARKASDPSAPSTHWLVFHNNGSSFGGSTIWELPPGGVAHVGFVRTSFNGYGAEGQGTWTGGQNWILEDMDGDGRPELVVTGWSLESGEHRLPNDPHWLYESSEWLAYSNDGAGFGEFRGVGVPAGTPDDVTGQCRASRRPGPWTLVDVNGDGLLDLLGPGEDDTQWRVHLFDGWSFSFTADRWILPEEGLDRGHSGVVGPLEEPGDPHRIWTTVDLNGDGLVDLVAMDEDLRSRTPDAPAGAHWSVYYQKPYSD